ERLRATAAPDFERIAEALGRDEGGLCASALQYAVDDDGGAMLEHRRLPDFDPILDEPFQSVDRPLVGQRGRRRLAKSELPRSRIICGQIGERPSDVDPDHRTHDSEPFSEWRTRPGSVADDMRRLTLPDLAGQFISISIYIICRGYPG